MRSPAGSGKPLKITRIEDGLTAYRCTETGGHYIPAISYMEWLSQQPARLPQLPPRGEAPTERELPGGTVLCPETGTIMTRYKVGHGFNFTIDRSITGGVWLEAGEWEALRSRNFHDEIHYIFTSPWQQKVRRQEAELNSRKRLEERLGAALLQRVEELKAEISDHPHRQEIVSYLLR